jgi:hypothetical protein
MILDDILALVKVPRREICRRVEMTIDESDESLIDEPENIESGDKRQPRNSHFYYNNSNTLNLSENEVILE